MHALVCGQQLAEGTIVVFGSSHPGNDVAAVWREIEDSPTPNGPPRLPSPTPSPRHRPPAALGPRHDRRDRSRRAAIANASQRKRLLLARYLGWAQGTDARAGLIGPAGERVVRALTARPTASAGQQSEGCQPV